MFKFTKANKPIPFEDTSYCKLFQTENLLPYIITHNHELIGYLFAEKRNNNELYINFIEIIDSLKEQGWGTQVVLSLFEAFNVDYLIGTIMLDDEGRAYYFWHSLGSQFSIDIDEDSAVNYTDDIYFVLENPKLVNNK